MPISKKMSRKQSRLTKMNQAKTMAPSIQPATPAPTGRATTPKPTSISTPVPSVAPTGPTQTPTDHPTHSPTTSIPTDSPTPSPTQEPTIPIPTPLPTLNPTSPPSLSPTLNPTALPTPHPSVPTTPSPTPEEHENCVLLKEGDLFSIQQSTTTTPVSSLYSSQCIIVPSKKNVIRVSADYIMALPSLNYQTMLISSFPLRDEDVIDPATRLLKHCDDICLPSFPASDCVCIQGNPRSQPSLTPISSMNSLYYMIEQVQPAQQSIPKYFTIFSDIQRNIKIQSFSIHGALLQTSPITIPLDFQLAPNQVSTSLLNNVNWVGKTSGHVQKLMMKLPEAEEDCLLQLKATPLFYSEDQTLVNQQTQRCLLDDDLACHVWLNPSMDYSIEVENIGRIFDTVELSVIQYPSMKGINQENVKMNVGRRHTAVPMIYVIVCVAFIFIWVLAILLVIAAVKKGNKAAKGFVNGMTGIFGSKKRHYLNQALNQSTEEEQRYDHIQHA